MTSKRRSAPISSSYSAYPTSPTISRDSRATRISSLFEYSTPRPQTHQSSFIPPLPKSRQSISDRSSGIYSYREGRDGGGETPLYARSDWDKEDEGDDDAGPQTQNSTYSRSSLGMTTAPLGTGMRGNTLGNIVEEDEESNSSDGNPSLGRYEGTWGGGAMVMSPNSINSIEESMTSHLAPSYLHQSPSTSTPMPAHKRTRSSLDLTSNGGNNHHKWGSGEMVNSPGEISTPRTTSVMVPAQFGNGITASPGFMTPYTSNNTHLAYEHAMQDSLGKYASIRKSTLPSVLELEHLTQDLQRKSDSSKDPFADPNLDSESPRLMSPGAQQKLGRMSVAPARYPHSPTLSRSNEKSSRDILSPDQGSNKLSAVPMKTASGLSRFYQTWRPFITPALGLVSALLLSISLQNNPGPISRYLKIPKGAFAVSPRGIGEIGLGVNRWCPLTGEDCKVYRRSDFSNANMTYSIPGDPLLSSLGDMITALCVLSWLSTLYTLVRASLHFYLFFILSIPFHHLLDEAALLAPNGGKGKSAAQAEVDIRVRCERPPFEGYTWVWWAWWGHQRAPVGHLFALLVSILAVASFGIAFGFKKSLSNGTGSKDISYGAGAYIPLIVFIFSMDSLINASRWLLNIRYEWNTFLHPPDPSPAAIMLPPQSKPMAHIRKQSGDSFFAPQTTFLDPQIQTQFGIPGTDGIPPLPGSELDEETRQWLMAYPNDPDLVPLIADIRGGKPNEDFLLSGIGLLYVAPSGDEAALLVPPKGDIRKEILEDAHHEPDQDGNSGHGDYNTMMELLSQTFWWETMSQDVRDYVDSCVGCKYDKGGVGGMKGMKPGMTPVPFTGVTGWTEELRAGAKTGKTGMTGVTAMTGVAGITAGGESVMAAEMAFAMRKAEEQAEKDRLA